MDLLFKLLLFPLAHWIIVSYRARFRKNVKTGDLVGIKFGDVVLNRIVYIRLENQVVALDFNAKNYKTFSMEHVFIPDYKALPNVSGHNQNLY